MRHPAAITALCLSAVFLSASAHAAEGRARQQPTVPDTYKEVPFVEETPAPTLTAEEKARGYLLFQRPIMDPVYPNTHPLPHERLTSLSAFATPGEFEPVTFSIYPVRDLVDLSVIASDLTCDDGKIPAANLDVRLLTYWNIGYPRYTSRTTYRRTPELLEKVTAHSSPAQECQRWWITVKVPDDAKPGLYRGTVTIADDGFARGVQLPVALRVLPFRLKKDPNKHYSVYYTIGNKVQLKDRDEAFIKRALGNEYKAMVDLGIDACPTLYLLVDPKEDKLVINRVEEFERMLKAGMKGPIPLAGGNAINSIYRATTPGGSRGSHWRLSKQPPPEFYAKVTKMFRALEEERKAKGWPELICCPLDEVISSQKEFGAKTYQAVRDGGIRTYITKNPVAADAAIYRPAIDIWCSQPFSVPYEKIVAQDRYEYWSYPNHNAGEVKDRRVMCKGGRMTYGFGFWRSGYTTLIPWHWAWTPRDDQFDYLRGRRSGCGQRLDDEGEVIPAVYWQCFREGRDDARYIYTLQQAVWERDGATDADCRRAVAAGKALLQSTWQDIKVQEKYLATNMWPSAEFNARRWRLAAATEALLRYPTMRQGTAPSVLVEDTSPATAAADTNFIADAIAQGKLAPTDLGGDFSEWVNVTTEGKVSVTPEAGKDGKPGLRWKVKVNHKPAGDEESDAYPIGWPRVYRTLTPAERDLSSSDYLMFTMRIDSNRDEVADDTTPIGFTIHSNKFYEVTRDLGGRQRVWLPVLFPIRTLIDSVGQGEDPWHAINKVQFFITERHYAHDTTFTIDVAEVKLLRFKAPVIRDVEAPQYVMLPSATLPVSLTVMGAGSAKPGSHAIKATLNALEPKPGQKGITHSQDLAAGHTFLLDAAGLQPGAYSLKVGIQTANGTDCGSKTQTIVFLPGPLWEK